MISGKPSRTAVAAATARAAHLHVYPGTPIHVDDFALRLVGFSGPDPLRAAARQWSMPSPPRACAYFALRHRYSEDRLERAIRRGVEQVVLLGAGLDSLALRRPELAERVELVEVDHPDSQRWKRARLQELGLATPAVTYLPVDFATESLEQRLIAADVRLDQPIFFSWLGVTQYIDGAANDATLRFIAQRPRGSEVVFDFIVRNDLLDPSERVFSEDAARSSAEHGEPWLSTFEPDRLEGHLATLDFTEIERLTPRLAASRYYGGQPSDVTPLEAWQVVSAIV
jgi:methyltransferase (TIGR00027 family)